MEKKPCNETHQQDERTRNENDEHALQFEGTLHNIAVSKVSWDKNC